MSPAFLLAALAAPWALLTADAWRTRRAAIQLRREAEALHADAFRKHREAEIARRQALTGGAR